MLHEFELIPEDMLEFDACGTQLSCQLDHSIKLLPRDLYCLAEPCNVMHYFSSCFFRASAM